MSNSWEEREKAFEDGYFKQKDNELIAKMRANLAAPTIQSENPAENLDCPKCDGKLKSGDFENIQIDVCDKCHGVWLDAGEMQQIVRTDPAQESWLKRLFD